MKTVKSLYKQFFWPTLAGLLSAVVFIQFQQSKPSQQIQQEINNTQTDYVTSYADAVSRALPSVVKIYTTRVIEAPQNPLLNDPLFKRFFENRGLKQNNNKIERGLGSGVIVSERGFILTNYHVIEKVNRIRVMLPDGRERLANIVGTDEPTDLAVLKIDLDNLIPATFAPPDSARIGDVVLAIGNPYGIGQTVTQGIVSATGRYGLQLNTYENYIQTDAAINQGNSGGALVNAKGLLIGINSGLYSRTGGSNGIGFAIPVKTAQYVLQNIIDQGEVVRGWLGVSVEDITPTIAEAFKLKAQRGLIVTNVIPNGPANKAGITVGDIITHINDELIGSGNAGMHQIAQTSPGEKIGVRLFRNGAALSLLAEVGKKPPQNHSGRS